MKQLTQKEVEQISGGSAGVVLPAGLSETIDWVRSANGAAWLATHPAPAPLQSPVAPPVGGVPGQWGYADPRDSAL